MESLEDRELLDGVGLTAADSALDLHRPAFVAAPLLANQAALLPIVDSAYLKDLGMAITSQATGAPSWIDFNTSDGRNKDGGEARVEVIRSGADGIVGRVSIPGAWLEPVVVGGNPFAQLSIPGSGFTDVIGAPRLPVVRHLMAIPDGVGVTARIDGQPHLLSTLDVGIGRSLAPLQTSVPKLAGALQAATLDYGLIYETDQFLPDMGVRVVEAGYSHGQRLVMLEVAPIAYNPAAGLLSVYDTLTFELDFDGVAIDAKADLSSGDVLFVDVDSSPDASVANLVSGEASKSAGRLLIVTHGDFTATMADFVTHKTAIGWDVHLVDTNTTGTTKEAIQQYIRTRYANAATRPDALLLVGDTDRIPYWTGSGTDSPATDLYYTTMDGPNDWYPEFPVGRFSVVDATQLSAVVDKTIAYETSSTGTWTTEATFLAGVDNHQITEGTHNWVVDNYMDPLGYTSNKLYQSTYGATTQDVRTAFNEGSALGIYSGHGSETSWSDGPRFTQADVRGLTNVGDYPLIASFACVTGAFAGSESLMETWLRTPKSGAVVAVGASVDSYWSEDDILEKRLFDAIYGENRTSIGDAWLRAKELYLQSYSPALSRTRAYFEMYNIMGDPTVKVLGTEFKIASPVELPLAYPDEPYEFALTAVGGREPYGWTLVEGSLPDGLTLDEATGVLGGTPTALAQGTFTIEATDANQDTDRLQFSLSVVDRLEMVTPEPLPPAQMGQPYSLTLQADGAESPYQWTLVDVGSYREANSPSGYLGGGTPMGWNSDDASWALTLPWAFPFYGNQYDSVNVSSNGFLDFASDSDEFENSTEELLANVRISPLWDDLVADNPGEDIFVTQTDDYVAVRWQARTYDDDLPVDVEAVLHRDGQIQFNYGQSHAGLTATIGVSSGNGADYTIGSLDGASAIPADVSTRYTYGGQLPPGLSIDEATGWIHGIPTELGQFTMTLRVQGSGTPQQTVTREVHLEVVEFRALMLSLAATATEGDGVLAGEVHITSPAPANLIVTLESDDVSEAAFLSPTVTILAGETSAPFELQILDDAILDGTHVATISASLDGYQRDSTTLAVADNETASITVTLPETAGEGDGPLVGQGRISIDTAAADDVVVRLTSDDTSEVTVASTVVIPAGQDFAIFDVGVENDTLIDGTQTVTIVARVDGWTEGAGAIEIADDDAWITLTLPEKVWEGSGVLPNMAMLTIGGTASVDLTISLESSDPGELLTVTELLIPAGETTASFLLVVPDDDETDGVQTVSITATAPALAGDIATIDVGDDDVHHFEVAPIASAQTAGVAFDVTVTAKDINNETIEIYQGPIDVTAIGDTGDLPIYIEAGGKHDPATTPAVEEAAMVKSDRSADYKANLGVYHDYAGVTSELAAYAAAYPTISRLVSIGRTIGGRELWAMQITDNPDVEEDEPEVKYVSTMHGNEPVGTEMSLYFIDRLLTGYGTDSRVTDLVDGAEIWILPLMNPDGHATGTRYNAGGADLNRSFPDGAVTPIGNVFDGPAMELSGRPDEVAYVMQWSADHSFVLSANFHTGALVVNYPYDNDGLGSVDSPTPDDALMEYVAEAYSQHNGPMWNSPIFLHGIVNGADWYTMTGGMQDWNYRYLGTNEMTIELSDIFQPAETSLPELWADNEESMLAYVETVHLGTRGLVTDAISGEPVFAEVRVQGNSQPVFTDPDVGDFHRMLLPGTYDLTFSAPGYLSRTVEDVVVTDGSTTDLGTIALVASGSTLELSNGAWTGRIAVEGLDTNVVLQFDDGLGHVGTSNAFDVGSGEFDHFELSTIASPQTVGMPFEVTVVARDANGYVVPGDSGPIEFRATGLAESTATILISEVNPLTPDGFELTNVSAGEVDIAGWQVVIYDSAAWPAPAATFTFPGASVVSPGDGFVVQEYGTAPGSYPNFFTGGNLLWNATDKAAVLLLDASGQPVDFVALNGADASQIVSPMAILPEHWQGDPVSLASTTKVARRVGQSDHNNRGDWQTGSADIGTVNAELTIPFVADIVPLTIVAEETGLKNDGVWTGTITITQPATGVVLQVGDGQGHEEVSNVFDLIAPATVVGRHVFYNHSAWDADDPTANEADDAAIAVDKQALLPGQTATKANYTNYSRGLNGILIDIAGLADPASLNAGDFEFRVGNNANPGAWSAAPAPSQITVREDAGADGADRVTLVWEDNAIEKQWLQVIVAATENTGLTEPDVFYFGNAVGEAGDQTRNAIVSATDEIAARNFQHGPLDPAAVDDPYDYNRDRLVNGTDSVIARNNQTNPITSLRLFSAPAVDELLQQSGSPQSDFAKSGDDDLAWAAAFEASSSASASDTDRDASRKQTPAQQAVDLLLATEWA